MTPPTDSSDEPLRLPSAGPLLPGADPAPGSADAPFLPSREPIAEAVEAAPAEFDARAMVEASRRTADGPAYAPLPTATPESAAATKELRAKARRKRKRNKSIGWFVGLLVLGVVFAAGWLAYQAYQDDQARQEEERLNREDDEDAGAATPDPLTPLGNQQEIVEVIDDLNSPATPSAGGLLDIVDDAREVVGQTTLPPDIGTEFGVADLLPASAIEVSTRLDDVDGFERYFIESAELVWADAPEYRTWLELMQSQPQVGAESPELSILPPIRKGQVGIAVQRDGERLVRAVVVGVNPDLRVVIG